MARLMVRSKSHQKLRKAASTTIESRNRSKSKEPVSNETTRPDLSPPVGMPPVLSKYASPASTPSFEVLSRPKTANAAMEEARKRNLMAMGDSITVVNGSQTFNFPTPASATSPPALMSRYANSPLALRPTMERSDTPDTIGIALGSPSHLAQFEQQMAASPMIDRLNVPSQESTPAGSPLMSETRDQKADDSQLSRPKVSRWKSIFSRKTTQMSQLKSQDEPSPVTSAPRSGLGLTSYHTWEHGSPRSPRLRSDTVPKPASPLPPKSPRWNLGRSQTAPTYRRNADSPPTPPKDFLAVNIPDTKMERYSIMFNGILPNQPGGLLARRQSKRESKNPTQQQQPPSTLEDLDIPPVPRRANTTSPNKSSPSYRLLVFPPDKKTPSPKPLERKTSLLHRPRPIKLKRSNTAPGALSPGLRNNMGQLSPMSEASEVETPTTEISTSPAPGVRNHTKEDESLRRDEAERQALTPTPSEPSTPTTPKDSQPLSNSPLMPKPLAVHHIPFQSEHARKSSTNLSVLMTEPDWEMITIGKVAEPGDRFSGAQVRVLEEPSPVEKQDTQTWHPLRQHSLVNKSKADAARERATAIKELKEATHARGKSNAHPNALNHAIGFAGATAGFSVDRKSTVTTAAIPIPSSTTSPTATEKEKPHPNLTSTMATQRLPSNAEVQIARSMSLTKAQGVRPVLKTSLGVRTSPRGVERSRGENLVEKGALTPVIINVESPKVGVGPGGGAGIGAAMVGGKREVGMGHMAKKSFSASIVEAEA